MQNYKGLKIWERSHHFTLKVYEVTRKFPKEELYSLTNQLRRASYSIPSNIAEGCGKKSQLEFGHFLNISLGSSNEAEYFLILSKDLGYLTESDFEVLAKEINEIKAMLIQFISKVMA